MPEQEDSALITMSPSRKVKQRTAPRPASGAADTEPAWDPYAQPDPQDEEVWDPDIDWEIDRIVGMELSSDGTKYYEVRWGAQWKRDDGSNTTWVSSKDDHDDVMHTDLPAKFESTLKKAAGRKAKASNSIDLNTIMTAWPHDWETAAHAEARDEKLERHRQRHANNYDTRGHFLMDWKSDIIRLGKDTSVPPPDLRRHSSVRSDSRTLSDAGTPHPFRAPIGRPARRNSISLRSESHASTLRPISHGPRALSVSAASDDIIPDEEPAGRPASMEAAPLALKALEIQWSQAAQAAGAEGLALVNEIDDELPVVPPGFQWIENTYIFLPGREPEPQYVVYCETCDDCEAGGPCNCIKAVEDAEVAEGAYADEYSLREPLLDRPHGFIVRECNPTCNCGEGCLNKVSQAPRNWTLDIFKTDVRGWGARTRDDLERGKILGIYTGTLRPPAAHDDDEMDGSIGNDYSFALDGGHAERDDQHAWSVNSYRAGNWTRFVNHSCDPNMRIYSRVTGEYTYPASYGQELYYIVFVAKNDIPANTELTLDYRPGADNGQGTGRERCLCGAMNCREWLYTV